MKTFLSTKKTYLILILLSLFSFTYCEEPVHSSGSDEIKKNQTHPIDWQPQNTWVFMVGVLEWKDANNFASFDKKGRIDHKILNFFKNIGVPENQIFYFKDSAAITDLLNTKLKNVLAKTDSDDTFFFYYAGHGYKNDKSEVCLASYDCGNGIEWNVNSIVSTIANNFKGKQVLLTADCCNSGGLAVAAKKYGNEKIVALNSVVPKDVSTGNWTFSNALLYGLKGENFTDTNDDKKVSLGELADFIDLEMAVVEGQKSAYYIPENLKNWVLTDNVPAKTSNKIGNRVNVDYDGTNYLGRIIEESNNKFNVCFYSYTNNETDWVTPERTKKLQLLNFAEGATVQVLYEKKWYPAKVLKSFAGLHYIKYDNYDESWNEWVNKDRIK